MPDGRTATGSSLGATAGALSALSPVRARSVVGDVERQLIELLRAGLLTDGDRLPGERDLAMQMQVSRASVSAAVAELQKLGVVATEPGRRGTVVASASLPADLHPAPAPGPDRFRTLLEARRTLEPALATLAAKRIDHARLEQLQAAVQEQRLAGDDRPRAVQAEGRFHRLMWRAAVNEPLERAMRETYAELEAVLDMAMQTRRDTTASLAAHEETLAALRDGAPKLVRAAMSSHLALMEEIYAETTGRRFRG